MLIRPPPAWENGPHAHGVRIHRMERLVQRDFLMRTTCMSTCPNGVMGSRVIMPACMEAWDSLMGRAGQLALIRIGKRCGSMDEKHGSMRTCPDLQARWPVVGDTPEVRWRLGHSRQSRGVAVIGKEGRFTLFLMHVHVSFPLSRIFLIFL